ncbi:MAG: hypothetical protein CR975_04835 [Gammaproteobacteria bacterium]|nr:MAG: hypothetical protein CR975_04835 [Gammaproteobacteria bacterium]
MAQQQINILALAVNERMSNVLEVFFEHHARELYQLVANGQRVDVVVADLDNYDGPHYSLDELLDKYPDTPIIVFSINAVDQQIIAQNDTVFFLKKPIVLDQLKETLSRCWRLVNNKAAAADKKPSATQAGQQVKKSSSSATPGRNDLSKVSAEKPVQTAQEAKPSSANSDKVAGKKQQAVAKPGSLAPKVDKKAANKQLPRNEQSEKNAADLPPNQAATTEAVTKINREENGKNLPFIGRREDVDLADAEILEKICFHPQNYIYYHLKDIINNKEKGTVLHVNIENECDFFLGPDNHYAKSPTPLSKRKSVASYYFKTLHIHQQTVAEDWDDIEGDLLQCNALLWGYALWAARGRLPADVDLDQPVRLKHRPDMNHYVTFPFAVKLAAVWSKHTLSIREISDKLHIPQRFIFSFYVACQAIDILDFDKGEIPFHVTEADKEVADQSVGVFKRILTQITK